MTKFKDLKLDDRLLRAIEEIGYQEPTAIQAQAIPAIIEGHDVLGRSNTGTGKTAAFGIPMLEMIEPGGRLPQGLILCPTRELVLQVSEELRKFSKYKEGMKVVPIFGGQSIDLQIKSLKQNPAIIVGTPGRIQDHLRRKTLRLNDLKQVILDEADEMLNMGFKDDIITILETIPHDEYQMILFSATMPKAIMNIVEEFQDNPLLIDIESSQRTIDTVKQTYYEVDREHKIDAIRMLLLSMKPTRTIMFCNTKRMVDELVEALQKEGIASIGLHGDMKQVHRSQVMSQYRRHHHSILIATDVAARGIDIDDIDLVINYDLPQDNEYYIHRIGRTGRAGKSGLATTLITGKKQFFALKDIMRYTKTDIEEAFFPSSDGLLKQLNQQFIDQVIEAAKADIPMNVLEIAYQLLAEDLPIQNVIGTLVSMNYQPQLVDVAQPKSRQRQKDGNGKRDGKRLMKTKDMTTLKVNIGKDDHVMPGHLVCALVEDAKVSPNDIGEIRIRRDFSLVDVNSATAKQIIDKMQKAKIRKKSIQFSYDKKPVRAADKQDRRHTRSTRKQPR